MQTESPESPPDQVSRCQRRSLALLFVFGFWSLLIVARLAQIMVVQRDRYLAEMTRTSWFQGTIPAIRGRILTADGTPLAWSTRHVALRWHVPESPDNAMNEWRLVNQFTTVDSHWSPAKALRFAGRTIILCRTLTPDAFNRLQEVRQQHPNLEPMSYFIRHRHPAADIQQRLGSVVQMDGTEIGVSGVEQNHDSLLRGRPGLFRVMLDTNGQWKNETWEQIRDMQPGYDVYLPLKLNN